MIFFVFISGDVFCTPLPYYVVSIWPLKTGLLIHKAADASRATSTSSPPLHGRDISRPSKEHGFSHFKPPVKDDPAMISSLLILKHPLEEPQVICSTLVFLVVVSMLHMCVLRMLEHPHI
jgi:Anaphase-promoting complex subunit 1